MEQLFSIAVTFLIAAAVLFDALYSKPTQDAIAQSDEAEHKLKLARKHARFAAAREVATHQIKNETMIGYKLPWGSERDERAQRDWQARREEEIFAVLRHKSLLSFVVKGELPAAHYANM